jgi:hypothetical protein
MAEEAYFEVRRTPGGGIAIYAKGVEIIHISPEEANKPRSRAELFGDMAKKLREAKDKGAITSQEAGFLLEMFGRLT